MSQKQLPQFCFLFTRTRAEGKEVIEISLGRRTPWMGDQTIIKPLSSVQQFLRGATAHSSLGLLCCRGFPYLY
jgi:hypothetical protein